MTSKESFERLHEIEARLKKWDTLEERDALDEERGQAIRNLVPEVGLKCTICYYSDYRAATVTQVLAERKVAVRFNKVKSGFSPSAVTANGLPKTNCRRTECV